MIFTQLNLGTRLTRCGEHLALRNVSQTAFARQTGVPKRDLH